MGFQTEAQRQAEKTKLAAAMAKNAELMKKTAKQAGGKK